MITTDVDIYDEKDTKILDKIDVELYLNEKHNLSILSTSFRYTDIVWTIIKKLEDRIEEIEKEKE